MFWIDPALGTKEPVPLPAGRYVDPQISPTGDRVAIENVDDGDDIWVYRLSDGNATRLVTGSEEHETPAWSRDRLTL